MTSRRILVVDDEASIREVVQVCLEGLQGWDVIIASSGMEALPKAELEQPDAILMDLSMPHMDGISTFQSLQSNSITRAIPVIFLTAMDPIQPEAARLSIAGVIPKPFDPLTLAAQIAEMLGWTLD